MKDKLVYYYFSAEDLAERNEALQKALLDFADNPNRNFHMSLRDVHPSPLLAVCIHGRAVAFTCRSDRPIGIDKKMTDMALVGRAFSSSCKTLVNRAGITPDGVVFAKAKGWPATTRGIFEHCEWPEGVTLPEIILTPDLEVGARVLNQEQRLG